MAEQWGEKKIRDLWKLIVDPVDPPPGLKPVESVVHDTEKGEWEEYLLGSAKVKRDLHTLYDPVVGFGVQLRWNLAAFELQRLAKKKHHTKAHAPIIRLKKSCKFQNDFFCLGSLHKASDAADIAIRKGILKRQAFDRQAELCKLVNEYFHESYVKHVGPGHLMIKELLFDTPLHGPKAPDKFLKLLRTAVRPLVSNRQLIGARPYENTPARETALARLENLIAGSNEGRPIVRLNSEGGRHGLEAFAHFWAGQPDKAGRKKFVIPINAYSSPHIHRGLGYLVANLRAYLEGEELPETNAPMSQVKIQEGIAAIREYLLRESVIIIFVGHEARPDRSAVLRRAIIDEPLVHLLSYLVHAVFGEPHDLADISGFERSYFVVLADGPMETLQAYTKGEQLLPQPSGDRLLQILIRDGYQEAEHICSEVRLMKKAGFTRLPHEIEIDAIEQLRAVERRHGRVPTAFSRLVTNNSSANLFKRLSATIRETADPLDQLMLSLIACCASGMRRSTLWRAMQVAARVLKMHCRPLAMDRDGYIDELKRRFSHLLFEAEGETPVAVGKGRHPRQDDLTLHYRHDPMRHEFLRHGMDGSTRRLLYRVLSGIALDQHVANFRVSDPSERVTVRSYRLAFESLLYGLSSLQAPLPELEADCWLDAEISPLLPKAPRSLFCFLYFDLFAQVVEAASVHRMSRQWAADDIKLAVLLLAHQAFGGADPADLAHYPAWAAAIDTANMPMLLRRHYEAIGVSAYRDGDREVMKAYQQFLDGGGEDADAEEAAARLAKLSLAPAEELPVLRRAHLDITSRMSGVDTAREMCWRLLVDEYRFPCQPLESGETPWASLVDGHSWSSIPVETIVGYVDAQMVVGEGEVTRCYATWVNLLVRMAEYGYEQSFCAERDSGARERLLLEALAFSIAAERYCELDARHAPFDRLSTISGKGQRVAARVAMALLSGLAPAEPSRLLQESDARTGWIVYLQRVVDRALGHYTLHGHTFAPDHVSALLLYAGYLRVLGDLGLVRNGEEGAAPPARARYETALAIIQKAEQLLIRFQSRPELRLRLAAERCATLRCLGQAIARPDAKDIEQAKRALALARHELLQLQQLTDTLFGDGLENANGIWHAVATSERTGLDALARTIDACDSGHCARTG